MTKVTSGWTKALRGTDVACGPSVAHALFKVLRYQKHHHLDLEC